MSQPPPRVRITISLTKEIADQIDSIVDGVRIRNRSHAVETLVTESLNLAQIRMAVVMAGGENVADRLPAITSMLRTLQAHGIYDVLIAVGYLGEIVRQHLGTGEQYGVRISYVQSELGTGGILREYKNRFRSTFLVVNVEQPVELDIKNLLKFHREHQPLATIATASLRDLSGVYVFEPKILQYIPEGFCMLEETVFHELTKQGKLLPYPILTLPST